MHFAKGVDGCSLHGILCFQKHIHGFIAKCFVEDVNALEGLEISAVYVAVFFVQVGFLLIKEGILIAINNGIIVFLKKKTCRILFVGKMNATGLKYCDLLFDRFEWLGILHFQGISNIYREAAKLRMRNLTALLLAAQVETARVSLDR